MIWLLFLLGKLAVGQRYIGHNRIATNFVVAVVALSLFKLAEVNQLGVVLLRARWRRRWHFPWNQFCSFFGAVNCGVASITWNWENTTLRLLYVCLLSRGNLSRRMSSTSVRYAQMDPEEKD